MLEALKKIFRKTPKAASRSFSQDGEDMIIRSLYEEKYNYTGFYIDIGALHPFRFSNTMYFYERGWRGINIEPTPTAIDLFNKFRPEDINLNIGVGKEYEELTFHCFNEPALNSFSTELSAQRDGEKSYFITERIPIKVYPLDEILDTHVPAGRHIDFMSIDVEGLDLQVLQSNNWEKFRPDYLLVEDILDDMDNLNNSEIYRFVTQRDYKLVAKTIRTLIFETK